MTLHADILADHPREDVGENVGVGVVERQLYAPFTSLNKTSVSALVGEKGGNVRWPRRHPLHYGLVNIMHEDCSLGVGRRLGQGIGHGYWLYIGNIGLHVHGNCSTAFTRG